MFNTLYKRIRYGNNGFALPIVFITLLVITIILISIAALAANNAIQTVAQEKNLRAHYLARSGIEIAYGALMTTEGGVPKLYDTFKDGGSNSSNVLDEVIDDLTGGTVYITVQRNGDWVTIYGNGVLDDDQGRSGLYLDIDVDDPYMVMWRE